MDEMAFAKFKPLLRKANARIYEALWRAVDDICDFSQREYYRNYLKDTEYSAD